MAVRDAMGRFVPDPANNKGRDRDSVRKLKAARKQLDLGLYEGRYCHHSEEILMALPGTASDVADRTGLPYSNVWDRLQTLYDCEWIHIGERRDHPNGGPMLPVYHAGKGNDVETAYRTARVMETTNVIKLDPNRKANPFDALLGYGT